MVNPEDVVIYKALQTQIDEINNKLAILVNAIMTLDRRTMGTITGPIIDI